MDSIKIDTKEVDRIAKVLGTNRDGIVRRMAFQVEGLAKQLAPYETSALRNSIYTETSKDSGYSKSSGEAKSARKGVETIRHPKPDEGFANVGPSVNYAESVELGHGFGVSYGAGGDVDFAKGFVKAQPYLTPAVEQIAQKYNSGQEWEELTK